jgi:hypothetical protein
MYKKHEKVGSHVIKDINWKYKVGIRKSILNYAISQNQKQNVKKSLESEAIRFKTL